MNLRENIRKVLSEGVKEIIIELIDSHGLESAISFVGGWEELKDIVKVLYYISNPNKFTKIDCKGIILKKK
jgi:hypothetical protein